MKTDAKSKGTWIHRFAIQLFTLVLAVLVFWVLGFFVEDIQSIKGPDYTSIEKKYLDKQLVTKQSALEKQIADLTRQIENQTEKQRVVGDGSRNLQQTINQLLELQKIGLQKNVAFSGTEQANFTSSLNLFLDNQKKYQELSQAVSDMLERKQGLVRDKEQAEQEIEKQRQPARDEFNRLSNKHRLKLAFFQLAILVPILIVAATVMIKKRSSIYFPLFLAFGAATLVKVALVVHEYFPSKYFKYILIGGLLLVVAWLLVYFIRAIAFPKAQWLIKQYREAYERFLCPVCEYPIRIGPRRFLFWTRRTVNKMVVPTERGDQEEKYTCPSCGSGLFEECSSCHKIRHVMLPHCSHCGTEKEIK
ncbi:MAG: hypothetical protein KKG09_08580 [Verrucomicrobia bacterium]|nr:hypothetical protein [Verrucomicrobiota bacterium]MBU4247234.1 hypothetical protein [Verrucomicrobiota bacterium]MBU4289960.1 hypothetical protein [Verrucomicrobiota bacterium]MBU4498045.1 hypothetical protein [Verrucomicrobiota bacterium]MCG2679692.1 hypothetical protein [Kiritimatiellia bacterium]